MRKEIPQYTCRLLAYSFAFLGSVLILLAQQSRAQCVSTVWNDGSVSLRAISFGEQMHGIIVGDAGVVLRTSDGGSSWRRSSVRDSLTNDFIDVEMTDSAEAVALGKNGEIFLTSDGGGTWRYVVRLPFGNLNKMVFSDKNNGIIVGMNGTLLTSSDGGRNWIQHSIGIAADLVDAAYPDSLHATILGNYYNGNMVLHTSDGGESWTHQAGSIGQGLFQSVGFSSSLNGMLLNRYFSQYDFGTQAFQTTDGGESWTLKESEAGNVFQKLSVLDAHRAVAISTDNILTTTDGGTSWNVQSQYMYGGLRDIAYLPSGKLILIGSDRIVAISRENCTFNLALSLLTPVDGSADVQLLQDYFTPSALQFHWRYSYDANVITTYSILQISRDSNFVKGSLLLPVPNKGNSGDNTRRGGPLEPGATYYWRTGLQYVDGSLAGWSAPSHFSTAGGVITGSIFDDVNHDGIRTPDERGIPNWFVDISGSAHGTIRSDANGEFGFVGLDSGQLVITLRRPFGWVPTYPTPDTYAVRLSRNETVTGVRFGNYFPWNSMSGAVFDDRNENGIRDSLEPGLPGWRVRIQGNAIDTAVTDSDGNYSFPRLVLGSFTLYAEAHPGWEQINPTSGSGYTYNVSNYDHHYPGNDFSMHRIPPRVKLRLYVKDSTDFAHGELWWGVRRGATFGIWGADTSASNADFAEGEFELPPQTDEWFDARFEDPRLEEPRMTSPRFGSGTWTDMREYFHSSQVDTFRVTFSPGYNHRGDYPMTLRWSKIPVESCYAGPVRMTDKNGLTLDMKMVDSLVITDPLVGEVRIVAENPRLPTLDVMGGSEGKPETFELFQNYPNPFNPKTVISYSLSVVSYATLKVYDVLGREVAILGNGRRDAGRHTVEWDAGGLASGVYFYRLEAVSVGDPGKRFMEVRKMVVLR